MKKNEEKNEEKKEEKKVSLNWIDDLFAVANIRNYEEKNVCFFNLYVRSSIGNVAIYGCKIVSGANGDFIAFPSQKSSDDRYYDVASVRFNTKEISDKIIEEVGRHI